MHYFFFCQYFFAFTLHILRINADENRELISPPAVLWGGTSPADVIVHLRANSYNISAFVPNHPGGAAVLRLVNGHDIEQYIEGRKCVLGICHRHRFAYEVLSQFEMPSDVVVGVRGKVYNISAFVPNHPGGPFVLKAVNGQRNVEQYIEGRKCILGICHRHSNAYEVLSQLEMSGLSTVSAPPLSPAPSSLRHPQNAPNSSLILPHFPGPKFNAPQKQSAQQLAIINGSEKAAPTNGARRKSGTELAFANDLHQQKRVEKEEQIGGKQLNQKEAKENVPKAKNNQTATEKKTKTEGKSNKKGTEKWEKPKDGEETAQNATKSQQISKKANERQKENGTKSEPKKGEEKREKRAKSRQQKQQQQLANSHSPLPPPGASAANGGPTEEGMPRGTEGRRRRVPQCLFVRRTEQQPHNYECA